MFQKYKVLTNEPVWKPYLNHFYENLIVIPVNYFDIEKRIFVAGIKIFQPEYSKYTG